MHAEYLEVSRALLQWSHRQPAEIAIKAELLAFGLELLVDQPDHIPHRQLIRMNAADLVTFVPRRRLSGSARAAKLDQPADATFTSQHGVDCPVPELRSLVRIAMAGPSDDIGPILD
jgi:hypothetical protein